MTIKSTHRKVPVADLIVDPKVQRVEGTSQKRVDAMVADWHPEALGEITVSQRSDGSLIVLDGAHRTAAARAVGTPTHLQAHVFTGLGVEGEAALFNLMNTFKAPSAISRFIARVTSGEKEAVEMVDVLAAHGWTIAPSKDPGRLAAVTALERVYRNGAKTVPEGAHPDLLDKVIEVVTAAWEHDADAVDQHILLAVAQLYGRFGASIDTKKLVDEMQATRPGVLVGKAKTLRDVQGGTVPAAMAKILAGLHNRRRRTNLLPEWVWIR